MLVTNIASPVPLSRAEPISIPLVFPFTIRVFDGAVTSAARVFVEFVLAIPVTCVPAGIDVEPVRNDPIVTLPIPMVGILLLPVAIPRLVLNCPIEP